jgi:hypothetical protein
MHWPFHEQCQSWSPTLRNSPHPPTISSLFCRNIVLGIMPQAENTGLDSWWSHWIFISNVPHPCSRTWALALTSTNHLPEGQTAAIAWR